MSIWEITLGMPLSHIPSGRFVCFIFTLWIWISMIVRSSYQGSLVSFLTETQYDNSILNMKDMIDNKFTFYGTVAAYAALKGASEDKVVSKIIDLMNIINSTKEYDDLSEDVAMGKTFGALLHFEAKIFELNYKFHGKGMLKVLQQKYRSQMVTIAFAKFSPMLKSVDLWIYRIFETGLINKWFDDFEYEKFPKEHDPVVIRIHHMIGPFMILFLGFFLSIVIFIIEIILKKLKVRFF